LQSMSDNVTIHRVSDFHTSKGGFTQKISTSKPDFMFLIRDSTQKMVLRKMFGHTLHNLQTHYHLKA
jgi:hypothetical protein